MCSCIKKICLVPRAFTTWIFVCSDAQLSLCFRSYRVKLWFFFLGRIFKHKNSMSLVSLLYWEEKWLGLYATNHFTDKEECACKQNFRKIQKKYWSIYINGFWVLKRKITYSSLCQRLSAVSRGQEWLSQGEDISHKSTPALSLCVYLIPSHQSAGEEDHGGLAPFFCLYKIWTSGYFLSKDAWELACSKCLKGSVGSMVGIVFYFLLAYINYTKLISQGHAHTCTKCILIIFIPLLLFVSTQCWWSLSSSTSYPGTFMSLKQKMTQWVASSCLFTKTWIPYQWLHHWRETHIPFLAAINCL